VILPGVSWVIASACVVTVRVRITHIRR